MAITILLPSAKLLKLGDLLREWPADRLFASVKEVRSLLGKLLRACEVARAGEFSNTSHPQPVGPSANQDMAGKIPSVQVSRRGRLQLTPEFHADFEFWRLMFEGALGSPLGSLQAPLYIFCSQSYSRTLCSDASRNAMGGYFSESGAWCRVGFDEDVRNRLRQKVEARDDLSINVLELLGMVVTAWAFIVLGANEPQHARDTILMRGDNMPAVHWVNHCRGGIESRSGPLMRILGCLEMGSGRCFQVKHVKGAANTLANGISRWNRSSIKSVLHIFRPDVNWQEQNLGQARAGLCTGVLGTSTSVDQLRDRLKEPTRQVSGLGALFAG